MRRTASSAALLALVLAAPAAASTGGGSQSGGDGPLRAGAPVGVKAASSSDAVATARKRRKRRKMPVALARTVTSRTAYIGYVNDVDAYAYGAYGCKRLRRWKVRCIAFVRGNNDVGEWLGDWYVAVWFNRRGQLRLKISGIDFGYV